MNIIQTLKTILTIIFVKIMLLNKKLHILFLSGWYPSRVSPQNGDFIQRHAEAIATKHKVTLIHVITDKNISRKEFSTEIINNVLTKIIYLPKSSNPISKFFSFFYTYLKEINSIGDFDLTHLNITYPKGTIALYLKWFKKKPYIITEHWSGYQFPQNNNIKKIVTKTIIKKASFICPVTMHLQKEMENFGLNGNYFPIPNVINTSYFNIFKNSTNNFIITHISGMNNKIKNVDGIINVISKLQCKIPNLQFYLIGSNSNEYQYKIEKTKIKNSRIIDQISNIEVANYLKKSNVFVLFSNYENLPCVIIESFACGVPVISTNVGGINEYFPKNFGYLINPKDEIALENAILDIYRNKITPNKIEMHKYADKKFGIETIAKQYSKIYYKTLKSTNC